VYIVKVPYCLRISEEIRIYEKLLNNSELTHAPCAPGTLETLSRFSILSRLKEPENSSIYSKMRVYGRKPERYRPESEILSGVSRLRRRG
jgi:serine protein kinase